MTRPPWRVSRNEVMAGFGVNYFIYGLTHWARSYLTNRLSQSRASGSED